MSRLLVVAGRTREDRRRLAAALQGQDAFGRPTFLYVTASQLKADALRRAWWDQPDKSATWLPTVVTKGAFLEDLAARFGEGRSLLGGVARSQLAGGLWRRLRPTLRAWSRLPDTAATRAALAEFAEAWGHAVPIPHPPRLPAVPEALRLPGEAPGGDPAVGPDLRHDAWQLLQAWREALRESRGWTDRAEGLRPVLRALGEPGPGLRRHLRRHQTLIVDDLLVLTPLEQAVLDAYVDAFVAAVPDGRVLLCTEVGVDPDLADFFAGEGKDEASLRATRSMRRAWGRRLDRHDVEALVADAEAGVPDLADHVAADAVVDSAEATATGLRVRRYPSSAHEVRAMARQLRVELLAGRPPGDCAVAFPSLDRYLPAVRDAFEAWGIPWVVERGEALATSPPVSAARRVLAAAADGVDRDGLRALLASGWVRLHRTASAERVAELAAEAFDEGPDRQRLLAALMDRAGRPRLATVERLHPAAVECGADGPRPREWIPTLARVTRASFRGEGSPGRWGRLADVVLDAWVVDGVARLVASIGERSSVRSVLERLREVLEGLGVRETARLRPEADPALAGALAENAAALLRFDEVAEGLVASLEAVDATLRRLRALPGEDAAVVAPAALLLDALDEALRDASFRVGERPVGVRLVGLRDLHGLDVPWAWVGGLIDEDFPRAPPPSFLLPGAATPLGEGDRGDEDRAVFGSLLRNAGHGDRASDAFLCLSTPATADGQQALPSSPLQDLLDLRLGDRDGETLGDAFAERQAAEEAVLPAILSVDELLASPALAAAAADRLAPALAARLRRHAELHDERSQPAFGRFDGVLGAGTPWRRAARNWLADQLGLRNGELKLTTTALEAWARCPQRYFFERVLSVAEPRAWQDELDAGERGDLVHEALRRLFEHRRRAGRASFEGAGPSEQEAVRLELARALLDAAAALRHRQGPALDRTVAELLAGLRSEDAPWVGRLARFVEQEAVELWGLEPVAEEWSFEDFEPAAAAHLLDDAGPVGAGDVRVLLRGQVDRVDADEQTLAIWDYKTGHAPHLDRVDEGLGLQPPVYLAAARLHLQGRHELDADASIAGYRELPADPVFPRRRTLAPAATLHELRSRKLVGSSVFSSKGRGTARALRAEEWAAWLRRADWYGQLVASGVFPTTLAGRAKAHCDRCAFRHACRLDELRNAEAVAAGGPLPAPTSASAGLEES